MKTYAGVVKKASYTYALELFSYRLNERESRQVRALDLYNSTIAPHKLPSLVVIFVIKCNSPASIRNLLKHANRPGISWYTLEILYDAFGVTPDEYPIKLNYNIKRPECSGFLFIKCLLDSAEYRAHVNKNIADLCSNIIYKHKKYDKHKRRAICKLCKILAIEGNYKLLVYIVAQNRRAHYVNYLRRVGLYGRASMYFHIMIHVNRHALLKSIGLYGIVYIAPNIAPFCKIDF